MSRRGLLKWISGTIAGALGVVLGIPAAIVLGHPVRRRTVFGADEPIDVASLSELPEGVPTRKTVRASKLRDAWAAFSNVTLGAVWLIRRGDKVEAFSSVCPHAGCAVDWDAQKSCFACPCHASVFGADGARQSGPAPRGMDQLECAVDNDQVRVTWLRFRQGVPEKEPA
jgi:Rieske Fe-S protein